MYFSLQVLGPRLNIRTPDPRGHKIHSIERGTLPYYTYNLSLFAKYPGSEENIFKNSMHFYSIIIIRASP